MLFADALDVFNAFTGGTPYPNVATQGTEDPSLPETMPDVSIVTYWRTVRLVVTNASTGECGIDLWQNINATSYVNNVNTLIQSWDIDEPIG